MATFEIVLPGSGQAVYHKLSDADALKLWRAEQASYVNKLKRELATQKKAIEVQRITDEIAWREKQTDEDGKKAVTFLKKVDAKIEDFRAKKN